MENFFTRYKNPLVLMAVLFIQVVALATQVKRPESGRAATTGGGTRLIRVWTVTAFTPVERMFVSTGHFFRDGWNNYANLRGVRKQNRDLQDEIARLQMEQVRLKQDADQAHRLQALLEFKQKFVAKTLAAQVIATSGTEQSRVIYIDKGSHDGIRQDMAVITANGIVGKIKDVFPLSSQVLLVNDHDSGVGVILEKSRLQGILKGTSLGELQISDVMADESVEPGETVITSGGDRIYPKGLAVGVVSSSTPDHDNDPFLMIKVKPATDLHRLEEVLVITKTAEEAPSVASDQSPVRAADILAQRLPSVPKQDPAATKNSGGATTGGSNKPAGTAVPAPSPATTNSPATKTGNTAGPAKPPIPATAATNNAGAKPVTGATNSTVPAKPASQAITTTGSPTPTPTPKPKAPAAKKAPAAGTTTPPNPTQTPSAQPGSPTPSATPEKPPR